MRKLTSLLLPGILTLMLPVLAWAETWKNAPLIDSMCLSKVKADPDKHPTQCLIQCSKSGYGILTPDGTYLKFDEAGNKQALDALKATKKKAGIRVTVTGDREGDTIKVKSVAIE